jgi:activator of HSP90 ATPase
MPWCRTERDCTKWFKDHFTKSIVDTELCALGNSKVTGVDKITGEMTYCNRKKKHMFFYELELHLKWEAIIDDKKISGQIRVPSFCDEEPLESTKVSRSSSASIRISRSPSSSASTVPPRVRAVMNSWLSCKRLRCPLYVSSFRSSWTRPRIVRSVLVSVRECRHSHPLRLQGALA